MRLALARAAEFMQASGEFDPQAVADGYSIDSRTIQAGELFFAVRGDHLDGHDYVEAALAKGAVGAVVRRDQLARYTAKSHLLATDDPLLALQQLAAAVRKLWGKPLIGVTGSAGKTTTKEIIAHVLSVKHRVLKSQGNLNNHFGLPLQLLKLEPEHDIAVIEMGMSHAGEISALAKLAQPNCGVVTLVAPVHLEFFESLAEIARAKYELIESLPPDGIAVINADDEYVSRFGRDFNGKVVTFGLEKRSPKGSPSGSFASGHDFSRADGSLVFDRPRGLQSARPSPNGLFQQPHSLADVLAKNIEALRPVGSAFEIVCNGETARAKLPLLGEHGIYNALAGVAVGLQFGVLLEEAAQSLASLAAGDKRGQVLEYAGATIINDCYNSNPKALDSMVQSLAGMAAQRRIVVAGEMLELGPQGEAMHRDCGRNMGNHGIDFVLGVRGLARLIVEGAAEAKVAAGFVATPEEAGEWLKHNVRAGDAVLLKASRGVRLERALDVWMGKTGDGAR